MMMAALNGTLESSSGLHTSAPVFTMDQPAAVSNDSLQPGGSNFVSVKNNSSDTVELVGWAVGCSAFSIIIFAFATYQYLRKVWNSPKAKKKKRIAELQKQFEKEEKAISEAQQQGPIAVEEFLKQLKKKKKKNWLDIEFKTVLKLSPRPPCDIARKPEHKKKNTYPTVLPFNNNRVILESLPNDDCSDYINASYIHSSKKQNAYIAAQGPSRHTIGDFWRMVWQENVHCIVMATNLFEHARQQCEKYWHNQHARYGPIDVWLQDTDVLADFVVRTFRVTKQEANSPRIVKQFQFNGWSDHDVPNPTAVLEYSRKIHVFAKDKPGPLLVHCSNGAGRTGAFIAIDTALEQLVTDPHIDVLNLVLAVRSHRPCLVRTAQQYEFVYDTIAMHLQCGVTVINVRELPTVVQKLSLKHPSTKQSGFETQLKTMQAIVPKLTVGECAGGHRAENRRKSRDIMMQPPERARPYLMTHDSNDSTDYINACYIDGYRHPNAFVVTQWPLKSTINDIWRLVFDYNIPTMVVLNEQTTSRSYPRFWPTDRGKHITYGPLTVEFVEETEAAHVTSRMFKVRKSVKYRDIGSHLADMTEIMTLVSMQSSEQSSESAKVMRIFHLRTWANNHRMPHNPAALVELLSQVEQWQMNCCHGRTPTLVVSRNGVSRVGTFCTISHCWDKMKAEGEVDVFTAAKAVKMNRPPLIDNLGEYQACYASTRKLLDKLAAKVRIQSACDTKHNGDPALQQLVVKPKSRDRPRQITFKETHRKGVTNNNYISSETEDTAV